jgi:hypothetical protein
MLRRVHSLRHLPLPIALAVLAAGAGRALAQSIYLAKSEPDFAYPRLEYIKTDVEFSKDTYNSKTGGGSSYTDSLYLAPTAGFGWYYFLYHPDLLTYSLRPEVGYNQQQNNNSGSTSKSSGLLVNGVFSATLLQLKPYATILNYSRTHDQFQYDFFNSATEDVETFGLNSGYREGAVPMAVSFQHSTTDSTSLSQNSTADQTTVGYQAQNTRGVENHSDLNYQFSQYNSSSTSGSQSFKDSTTTHYLTMSDAEYFGKNSLHSSLDYNEQDYQGVSSDNLDAALDFGRELTANLRNFEDYSVARFTTTGNNSLYQMARSGLQHQLYESLTSSADVHGTLANNNSSGGSLDLQSVGTTASVGYAKRLADWGRLGISENANYDLTHQESAGVIAINNESHTVPLNGLFFLNQPNDQSVQSVRWNNGSATVTLVEGAAPAGDYVVITTSNPWQIQISSGGPNQVNLARNPVVLVDYTAQPNPSGDYTAFNDQVQIRLDFWHQRAGIYARYNYTVNHSTVPGAILNDIAEFQAGGDLAWNGFRADLNYSDRISTLYNYQSVGSSEGYTRRTSAHTTVGIDFHQQWSLFPNTGTNQSPDVAFYSFTGRFEWRPVSSLSLNCESGYEIQRSTGQDENLIVARSYLSWFVGKLDVRLAYEFQNQDYTFETRARQFVSLRVRRNF